MGLWTQGKGCGSRTQNDITGNQDEVIAKLESGVGSGCRISVHLENRAAGCGSKLGCWVPQMELAFIFDVDKLKQASTHVSSKKKLPLTNFNISHICWHKGPKQNKPVFRPRDSNKPAPILRGIENDYSKREGKKNPNFWETPRGFRAFSLSPFPAPTLGLTTFCNSSFRGSDAISCHQPQMWHIYIIHAANSYIHEGFKTDQL